MLYYVIKMGAYSHGVFGIFEDLADAKNLADLAASEDEDGYHEWCVLQYSAPNDNTDFTKDSEHEIVYRAS